MGHVCQPVFYEGETPTVPLFLCPLMLFIQARGQSSVVPLLCIVQTSRRGWVEGAGMGRCVCLCAPVRVLRGMC